MLQKPPKPYFFYGRQLNLLGGLLVRRTCNARGSTCRLQLSKGAKTIWSRHSIISNVGTRYCDALAESGAKGFGTFIGSSFAGGVVRMKTVTIGSKRNLSGPLMQSVAVQLARMAIRALYAAPRTISESGNRFHRDSDGSESPADVQGGGQTSRKRQWPADIVASARHRAGCRAKPRILSLTSRASSVTA
jgi:hypothetical protein